MDFKHQGEAAVASAVENLDKDTPSSAGFSVAVAVQSGDLVTSMFLVFFHSPEEHHEQVQGLAEASYLQQSTSNFSKEIW